MDSQDKKIAAQINLLSLSADENDLALGRQFMEDGEVAYLLALGQIGCGHDVRVTEDLLQAILTGPEGIVPGIIVEEGEGPVLGRRVLAMADHSEPTHWSCNLHNTAQQADLLWEVAPMPEEHPDLMVADAVEVAFELMEALRHRHERELLKIEGQPSYLQQVVSAGGRLPAWQKFCAVAGRTMHQQFIRAEGSGMGVAYQDCWNPAKTDYAANVIDAIRPEDPLPSQATLRSLATESLRKAAGKQAVENPYSLTAPGREEVSGQGINL